MSKSSPVSMQELELESAEVLPGRETLCVSSYGGYGGSVFEQLGYGNTVQSGLLNIAIANGSLGDLIKL